MKICLVCSEYPPFAHGGIGSATQVLSRALAARGHHVRVVGVYPEAAGLSTYSEDEGVEVWRLRMPSRHGGWIAARYALFRKVASWAAQRSIDLVEAPDWEGWLAGWPRLPIPVISRLHGSICYFAAEMRQQRRSLTYWLERAALRRSDFWCSVSRYTADKTRGLFALKNGPGTVIYNCVDSPPEQSTVRRSRTDVVFTGTLTEKKGVVPLFRAWPLVHAQVPDARLHVYGKDPSRPDRPSMRETLTAGLPAEVRHSVFFHGHVQRESMLERLGQARAAVFPSFAEAFAMAPLEAMAYGCPTIYSKAGSGPELIEDGRDGLLIDPSDPAGIARAVIRVLKDDALATQLSEAGRAKVKSAFSTGKVVRANETFYGECLESFRASSHQ